MPPAPARMPGTPSRTVAITLLLLLIGCGLGGGGFLYVRNGHTLFPPFVQATLIVPPGETGTTDATGSVQREVPPPPCRRVPWADRLSPSHRR